MKKIMSVSTLGFALPALAQVHLKDGKFIYEVQDELTVKTGKFKLSRTYSSRSYHKGPLGFGWCSILEEKLDLNSPTVLLQKCDQAVHENGIVFKDGRYLRYEKGKVQAEYDIYGYLQRIHTDEGHILKLERDLGGRIRKLRTQSGEKINVLWDQAERHIIALRSKKSEIQFRYKNGDLISWHKKGSAPNRMVYDESHNLTAIMEGHEDESRTKVRKIAYEQATDTVRHVWNDPCRYDYQYSKGDALTDITEVTKKCEGKKTVTIRQEYIYQKSKEDQQETLIKVRTVDGRRVSEVQFDPKAGRPLKIDRGHRRAHLKYAHTGELTDLEITTTGSQK